MVVRFEVDAYRVDASASTDAQEQPSSDPSPNLFRVNIEKGGSWVPEKDLIEIKTVTRRGEDFGAAYRQMYLSQTRNLYYASHVKGQGIFDDPIEHVLGEGSLEGGGEKANDIKKLRKSLGDIRTLVLKHRAISLVYEEKTLKVCRTRRECLPKNALKLFKVA